MTPMVIKSKVGSDGVLHLDIPIGAADADREVRVTIEPAARGPAPATDQEEWRAFVARTAGSITDPTFKRHEQGDYEQRASLP